jgi:hypothetical protein
MNPLACRAANALAAVALSLSLASCSPGDAPEGERSSAQPSSLVAAPEPAATADSNADATALALDETPDTATAGVPEAALALPPPEAGFDPWFAQVLALDGGAIRVAFSAADFAAAAAPSDTVVIGQASWRLVDGAWQPLSSAADIGRFGGDGRAPGVDAGQDARVYAAPGRVLLAVPTEDAANSGTLVYGYELFSAEGEPLAWRHVGRVPAGSDNRAGCSEAPGAALPCASTAGTLAFLVEADPAAWPTLRLALQGTVVDGPGAVRATTDADVVTLRFDAAAGRYAPVGAVPEAAY